APTKALALATHEAPRAGEFILSNYKNIPVYLYKKNGTKRDIAKQNILAHHTKDGQAMLAVVTDLFTQGKLNKRVAKVYNKVKHYHKAHFEPGLAQFHSKANMYDSTANTYYKA